MNLETHYALLVAAFALGTAVGMLAVWREPPTDEEIRERIRNATRANPDA